MSKDRIILITGGAGFIGSNLAQRLLSQPDTSRPNIKVRIFDDLSRRGAAHNLAWLQALPQSSRLEWIPGDIRDAAEVARAAKNAQRSTTLQPRSPSPPRSISREPTSRLTSSARSTS